MMRPPRSSGKRQPPVAMQSHDVIEEWIGKVMPYLHPIVKLLDQQICEAIPDLEYAVKWRKAFYGRPGQGWLMELVAYDVSANLVFFAGADFESPPPLGEGSRFVKIRTLDEASQPELAHWIAQAGKLPGWQG